MAISAIQPITNFSTLFPATSVSPPELLSIATDFVVTTNAQAVVTLGETETVAGQVFDSTGQPLSPGATAQTPQSQALADQLLSGLDSTTSFIAINNIAVFNAQNGTSTGISPNDLALLQMNLLNVANLDAGNTASPVDFTGVLASSVELAIAGIGTGNTATAGIVTPNGTTANTGVNALLGTPTTTTPTTTIATATPTTATVPAATVAPATVPTATAPTVIAPPAIAPAATAPAVGIPVATVPAATAPPALTVPTTTAATTAAAATTPSALPTAAQVLQGLIADVNGRALANLIDPGFASTSANLFVAATVIRASSGAAPLGLSTADIAGNPPPEVTAAVPTRTV